MRIELGDGWTLHAAGGDGLGRLGLRTIPAEVPGCVHLDLLAAGDIPDPYADRNEDAVAWVGTTDWTYTTNVVLAPSTHERLDLVADGLDTVAEVRINGVVVGTTRNMHRRHRFDVRDLVHAGENEVAVTFRAPIPAAHEAQAALGTRPHVNTHPYNALRKNANSFGWDWGPDLPTSGIWRPIAVEAWSGARIAGVRPQVALGADGTGLLDVHVDLERESEDPLEVVVHVDGRRVSATVPADATEATVHVDVRDVEPWWPLGHGGQRLYALRVELVSGGRTVDEADRRIGFRSVEVEQEPDAGGTGFVLRVNGRRIDVRGFNWIPDDAFLPRIDRGRYQHRIEQAVAANANLLRVWGGGIYESDDFYDVCDELGVLVWQDFAFACAAYAEEEPLATEVLLEAVDAVTRLVAHPSLALWCGGNECLWGHEDWDWKQPLAGRTWGSGYYGDVLPGVLARLDPDRPYVPGSPCSPGEGRHPNDPAHGPMHIWDVWNERDWTAYRTYRPRFVSEFGWQGPAAWRTLSDALSARPLARDDAAMLTHQKADDGDGKLARGLAPHLPVPDDYDDWHWATSLNQARALRAGIEHFRSLAPHCSGVVVWQLNDCWPVVSWSVVDGAGRLKPAWYAVRAAYADRLVAVVRQDGGLELAAVNDRPESWLTTVAVRRVSVDGTVLAEQTLTLDVAARSGARIPLYGPVVAVDDARRELLVVEADGLRAIEPFAEDVDATWEPPLLDVHAARTRDGWSVQVRSDRFVRDLALLVDRISPDAEVDEMLVTLLPGESVTFHVTGAAGADPFDFGDPLVLRSAHQLVSGRVMTARTGLDPAGEPAVPAG